MLRFSYERVSVSSIYPSICLDCAPFLARASRPRGIYDLSLPELETRVRDLGFPAYRAPSALGLGVPAICHRLLGDEPISRPHCAMRLRPRLLSHFSNRARPSQQMMERRSRRSIGRQTIKSRKPC